MEEKIFEAKSVDQAIEEACRVLGCLPEDLEIEILEHGSSGLFGIGAKKAKIKVRMKPEKLLSERANRAVMFLKELFLSGELKIEPQAQLEKDYVKINLEGEDAALFTANGGTALEALEFLTNKIVARRLGVGAKIVVDVNGFRENRERRLIKMAREAADKAKRTRKPISLPPMNAKERRIVHLALKDRRDVHTRSAGEGERRHVVVYPGPPRKK
ncbi:RNA-binding protein Jag [Thermosulfurimonas dismutans]|uniref:RNA-binding protein KhpB n=2 Tax=Thermosulfurimonas dismutans TaxID=999894 RepID=A0A179D6I0_9BACT|nr:RNA-binding protein Jag [Thermosulfurimonas dismutans]